MAIRATGNAELIGIGAELCFKCKSALKCFTRIFPGQHVVGFGFGEVEVSNIPGSVVGKFIIRGQQGVCFAIPLNLGDFIHPFPLGTLLDIEFVEFFAGILRIHREHDAVR